MSSRRSKFYPGWMMTWDQHNAYFRLLSQVYAALGLPSSEHEAARKQIHERAFGAPISAKQIDHLKMFDAFKSACMAIIKPASIDDQKRLIEMPRTRLLYAIGQIVKKHFLASVIESAPFRSTYVASLMIDRFGHMDIDRLDLEQLEHLRNTLADRAVKEHKPETLARRRKVRTQSPASLIENTPF